MDEPKPPAPSRAPVQLMSFPRASTAAGEKSEAVATSPAPAAETSHLTVVDAETTTLTPSSVMPLDQQSLEMLDQIIQRADAEDISDIQFRTDRFIYVKTREGYLPVTEWGRMSGAQVESVVTMLHDNKTLVVSHWQDDSSKAGLREILHKDKVVNFACEGGPLTKSLNRGRLRCQAYLGTTGLGITVRILKEKIVPIDNIGLPKDVIDALKEFVSKRNGLGLVTGPTGSGKTTTLASLIEWLRLNSQKSIITVEDPVEYTYPDVVSSDGSEEPCSGMITQQEVGTHVNSFAQGLRDALRKRPDVILIGEIRDRETMQTCMEAAQTGHLVLSTLHTRGAAKTLARVGEFYSEDRAKRAVEMLSDTLHFILTQGLIPSNQENNYQLCCEFLRNTETATRSAIAKYASGETAALQEQLARRGNHDWDTELKALFDQRLISEANYQEYRHSNPEEKDTSDVK